MVQLNNTLGRLPCVFARRKHLAAGYDKVIVCGCSGQETDVSTGTKAVAGLMFSAGGRFCFRAVVNRAALSRSSSPLRSSPTKTALRVWDVATRKQIHALAGPTRLPRARGSTRQRAAIATSAVNAIHS